MGKFASEETAISGVKIITPQIFGDERGYFMETYNEADFKELGLNNKFVQDNQSRSRKGVLRGLHFQKNHPQAKLVRVIKGEVYDVAVDLRESSPTFGKYVGVILSEENKKIRSEQWKGSNNPIYGKTGKDAHHITPVYKRDKETNEIICKYDTIQQAENDTGASHGNIVKCCTGDRKTAAGFRWSYVS